MINVAERLSSFDSKERASFRARKSKWIKKGFPPEKAIELALNPRHKSNTGLINSPYDTQSATCAARNPQPATCNLRNPQPAQPSRYEPTRQEIADVVRRLKSGGVMREIRAEATSNWPLPAVQKDVILPALEMIIALLIVGGASSLLIASTLEVFGASWQGWTKALLLELGIIALYLFRPAGLFQWLLSKGAFMFLLTLSFMVLRTGVETVKAAGISNFESSDRSLADLFAVKKALISSLEALPASYIAKRQPLLNQINDLDVKIEQKRSALTSAASASVVSAKALSEVLMRLALILLNLIFSHRLLKLMDDLFNDVGLSTDKRRVAI